MIRASVCIRNKLMEPPLLSANQLRLILGQAVVELVWDLLRTPVYWRVSRAFEATQNLNQTAVWEVS